MKTGILWDLDGTLLNTIEDLTDAVNYALAQYQMPPRTSEEVRRFIGNGARRLIALSMSGTPTEQEVDAVLETYQIYYKAHAQIKTKPYDGILDALKTLGQKYPMAIVSNKPDAPTKILCAQYFPGVYARGESTDCPRKPAPDMLLKAMADVGVERCVYVGDSEVDVITAGNVGGVCLSVTWGFRDKAMLEAAGGKYFCEDPRALVETLEAMIAELWGE